MRNIVLIITFFFLKSGLYSQNYIKEFKKLNKPERCWAIKHPFVAKKAFKLTNLCRRLTDSLKETNTIGKDVSGGKLDVFRHSLWMALIAKNISKRTAFSLGIAHEKSNFIDYTRNKNEDMQLPDKMSCDMDFWNNLQGIEIGIYNRKASLDSLQFYIIQAINQGKMKIIKKNSTGSFVDEFNNTITNKEILKKWINNKYLVFSDK